jgi:hypothetical protein
MVMGVQRNISSVTNKGVGGLSERWVWREPNGRQLKESSDASETPQSQSPSVPIEGGDSEMPSTSGPNPRPPTTNASRLTHRLVKLTSSCSPVHPAQPPRQKKNSWTSYVDIHPQAGAGGARNSDRQRKHRCAEQCPIGPDRPRTPPAAVAARAEEVHKIYHRVQFDLYQRFPTVLVYPL